MTTATRIVTQCEMLRNHRRSYRFRAQDDRPAEAHMRSQIAQFGVRRFPGAGRFGWHDRLRPGPPAAGRDLAACVDGW
jgi:hypothetical protein